MGQGIIDFCNTTKRKMCGVGVSMYAAHMVVTINNVVSWW